MKFFLLAIVTILIVLAIAYMLPALGVPRPK